MARGGTRIGAGRKAGSATKRTREIADAAFAGGITPLEVMLATMRERWLANDHEGASAIAKDAAPYVHPRLTTATVNANVRRTAAEYSDAELAALAGEGGGEDRVGEAT